MWTRLFQELMLVIVVTSFETHNNKCPHSSQRKFRSHAVCKGAPQHYSCLFDTNRNDVSEYCNIRPDFSAPGEYYVFTGSRRNIECTNTTYQPFPLWSNESSKCTFKKSLCTESGQVLYTLGSTIEDGHCRCDYTKRYAFVIEPSNHCYCVPSEEDCSCYIKHCGLRYSLNADYECKLQSHKKESKCEANEHLATNEDEIMQIEKSSDRRNVSKSEKDVLPAMILILMSVVLIILQAMSLLVCCFEIRKVQRVNKSKPERDFKVVAAIDLGTTFSQYASSTIEMFGRNPLDIRVMSKWFNTKCIDLKTCILMERSGKCVSLGDTAMDDYVMSIHDEKAEDYLFFNRFKMELYDNENISNIMVITDEKGDTMKAIDVFSTYIHELMGLVQNDYLENGIESKDIQWVFTVPAVWSNTAISFMRQCAEKTGVRGNRLIFVSEPEAVAVYFQYLHDFNSSGVPKLDNRYIVVDIGGGTVDITAHERTEDGKLTELCKLTVDNKGSSDVDETILDLLSEIFGKDVLNSLLEEEKYKDSYFDILKEIESFKRNVFASTVKNVFLKVPIFDLEHLCKEHYHKSLHEKITSSTYRQNISLKKERIKFERSLLSELFTPVVNRMVDKVKQVLKDLEDYQIGMILLAGGLSKSPVIANTIKYTLNEMKIITIPQEYSADIAVVMGAVLYGHYPHFITSRITKYTYGVLAQPPFEIDKHDEAKRITINGRDLCNDVFEVLVKKDTKVHISEKIQKEYKITNTSEKQLRIAIYATENDNVNYVDDVGCKLFCEGIVHLANSTSEQHSVIVEFIFGYAEFQMNAFEQKTRQQYKVVQNLSEN